MSNRADLQYTLGLDGSGFDSTAKATERTGMRLGSVLAGLGATAFAGGVIKRGLDFNKTMNDSEAAIAKVIAQFQGLDDVAAKGEAGAAMRQLIELEPKAAGSLSTLVDGFLSTLAASQSAGLSVKQNIDLVGRFANAMANANIPTEQLGQEMRSIITGTIGADSSLARILSITNEMVGSARESGRMYDFLVSRIGKLGEAGDTAAVAFSSLQSALDKAAGVLTAPMFERVLQGSKDFTGVVEDLTPKIERLGEALGGLIDFGKRASTTFIDFGTALGLTAGVYADMITNGSSYAEAWERAESALTDQINERAAAQEAATKATQSAPAPAAVDVLAKKSGGASDDARRQQAQDMAAARNNTLGELAILKQQAAGHDRKADAIRRQLRIEKDKLDIMRQTGASEAEALRLAKEKADLEDKVAKRGDSKTGRSHIGGVTKRTMMGGGVADVAALQASTSEFQRLQKGRETKIGERVPAGYQSGDYIRTEAAFPSGPRSLGASASRVSRLMGQTDARPLSDRAQAVMTPPAKPGDKPANTPAQDPQVAKLDAILTELTRIRTA